MPLQTRSIRMWSGVAPPPEIITRPAINTARELELGSTTGEAALGRFTGPPACAGSLTLPRCAKAAEAREITAAISLRRAEGRCMGPPGQSCCQAAPSPRKAGATVHQCTTILDQNNGPYAKEKYLMGLGCFASKVFWIA